VTAAGRIPETVERGDIDELIGLIDGLCLDADWDGLTDLARRCRAALERGRQLWPAAAHADYRLALEAPAAWAGPAVAPGRGRFAPGPLTEVVASTHGWSELAGELPDPALAAVVAQERALRGEDLTADRRVPAQLIEVPLALQPWEPDYPLATYRPDGAEFPSPAGLDAEGSPAGAGAARPTGVAGGGADDGVRALRDLVAGWTEASSGRADAVVVEGDARAAAAALGMAAVTELAPDDALARMAWCGASGGAHGRRRGMASGRFGAWWALAAVSDRLDDWPVPPEQLGAALDRLEFLAFEVPGPPTGWRLGLAIGAPGSGRAWAVSARDPADGAV